MRRINGAALLVLATAIGGSTVAGCAPRNGPSPSPTTVTEPTQRPWGDCSTPDEGVIAQFSIENMQIKSSQDLQSQGVSATIVGPILEVTTFKAWACVSKSDDAKWVGLSGNYKIESGKVYQVHVLR